jgi:hypothetical protein
MANSSNAVPLQVEYDPKKRRISLNRIFQIPQMFRPAASVFFANTLGRLNLDRPAIGLTAIAGWFRFSRWRRQHAVAHPVDGERHDRRWLYKLVIAKENLKAWVKIVFRRPTSPGFVAEAKIFKVRLSAMAFLAAVSHQSRPNTKSLCKNVS